MRNADPADRLAYHRHALELASDVQRNQGRNFFGHPRYSHLYPATAASAVAEHRAARGPPRRHLQSTGRHVGQRLHRARHDDRAAGFCAEVLQPDLAAVNQAQCHSIHPPSAEFFQ